MFLFLKEKTALKRILFFAALDIVLISLSVVLAFFLRFEGKIPFQYIEEQTLQQVVILTLLFCLPVFYFFGLYSFSWSYVSTKELISLFKAITLSFVFLVFSILVLRTFKGFPRSILIISYFLIFVFCGAVRFAKRIYLELIRDKKGRKKEREKVLIIGAGDAGEQILRSILSLKDSSCLPVGFVDDSASKQGLTIHGVKVLGKIEDIPKIVKKKQIKQVIVALPSVSSKTIKRAVELSREAGLKNIKVVPSMAEIIDGEISVRDLREIQIEDLLGRQSVELNTEAIKKFIKEKNILISGAAGSIGSELSRQVAKFKPASLLLLDQDETGIFNIFRELKNKFPYLKIQPLIANITDSSKVNYLFSNFKPNIVFHAAAYKHVPLMEEHPDEAVKNNIFGTKIIAEAAKKYGVEKFVFISTDKAINPVSVMGATKRVGEAICQFLNQQSATSFVSVRFGNVLNSRGSVVPIFKEQIKAGGPVEVTHPEMKRYFMTISEACLLVMQAAEIGQGGEVFVLDMGKPIRILDLAKEMIRLSGFEPDKDIPIVFIGPRPGEKFFEEILTAEEGVVATQNQKIFKAKLSSVDEAKLKEGLEKLKGAKKEEIKNVLKEIISS